MKKMMPIMIVMLILVVGGIVYAAQGISMHNKVAVDEAKFNTLQDSYYTQSKATRDGATTGSQLNKDLSQIQQYPSQLLFLKLVGIGKILTGIFALLFAILIALIMMPVRLAGILQKMKQ